LLLHGLAPAARRAVLAQLATADADRLKPLLSELEAMGISPSLGRRLNASVTAASGSSPEKKVEELAAEAIVDVFGGSAPITIAQFMRSRDWSWKAQALARFSEPTRGAVAECLRRDLPVLPPAAVRRLCERVCERVERAPVVEVPVEANEPAGLGSRFARIAGWMR
jgi:hypothetical protein